MELDSLSTSNRRILDFRLLGFEDLLILGKYNYQKAEAKLAEHRHPGMLEVCYYDKGSQYFLVDDKQHLVTGGQVFVHYPDETHGSGGYPESKGVLYWMIIKMGLDAPNNLVCLSQKIINKKRRHFKGSRRLKQMLEGLLSAYESDEDPEIKKIRIYSIAQFFLLELLDCISREQPITDRIRFDKILSYIHEHIREPISIGTLAAEMNLSESRFKSLFKDSTGFTPRDYIQREKVRLAMEAISTNPGRSFTDLAYELNFSSPQYFSTVVKKYTGSSPGTLKENT